MKVKLRDIILSADYPGPNNQVIPGSLSKLLSKELPVKISYHLGKLRNIVQSELKQYYLNRDSLIKKYGKEKNGDVIIESPDFILNKIKSLKEDDKNYQSEKEKLEAEYEEAKAAFEKFNKDNDELLDTEVEISYSPFSIEQLGEIKISALDMSNLEWLFEDLEERKLVEHK